MSVLDALGYIKDNLDKDLAYRWSCRMAICGSCGMIHKNALFPIHFTKLSALGLLQGLTENGRLAILNWRSVGDLQK